MKLTFILFFIFTCLNAISQEVSSFKLSKCDMNSRVDLLRNRIISSVIKNDTLIMKIGFVENCCIDLNPSIQKIKDTLFLSLDNKSSSICMCECCFEMELIISNVKDTNFIFMLEKHPLKKQSKYPKLPHEYIFDENSPLNSLNSKGLKIGRWFENKGTTGNKYEVYYDLNPTDKEKIVWFKVYNNKDQLVYITIYKNDISISLEPAEYSKLIESFK